MRGRRRQRKKVVSRWGREWERVTKAFWRTFRRRYNLVALLPPVRVPPCSNGTHETPRYGHSDAERAVRAFQEMARGGGAP